MTCQHGKWKRWNQYHDSGVEASQCVMIHEQKVIIERLVDHIHKNAALLIELNKLVDEITIKGTVPPILEERFR